MTKDDKISILKQRFLASAFVKNAEQGYIVVKDFNLTIDPDVLQLASKCWAEHYHQMPIDAIVGLPDAGSRLVSILAEMLRVKIILPSKRATNVPGSWENVISFHNKSFTTGTEDVVSHIGFIKPGMKVLLVDDVIAHGSTALAAIDALQARDVEVLGLAVLFDKAWQGGVEQIVQRTGICPFSLIRIQQITDKGEIAL